MAQEDYQIKITMATPISSPANNPRHLPQPHVPGGNPFCYC
jgi:hypothetical protein